MILAVDIGNTNIVLGFLEGKELVCEEGEVKAGKTVIMEIKQK